MDKMSWTLVELVSNELINLGPFVSSLPPLPPPPLPPPLPPLPPLLAWPPRPLPRAWQRVVTASLPRASPSHSPRLSLEHGEHRGVIKNKKSIGRSSTQMQSSFAPSPRRRQLVRRWRDPTPRASTASLIAVAHDPDVVLRAMLERGTGGGASKTGSLRRACPGAVAWLVTSSSSKSFPLALLCFTLTTPDKTGSLLGLEECERDVRLVRVGRTPPAAQVPCFYMNTGSTYSQQYQYTYSEEKKMAGTTDRILVAT